MNGLEGFTDGFLPDGVLPDGSVAHDFDLVTRLANDMFRGGFALAQRPGDPFAVAETNGMDGADLDWHRERLMEPELRYRGAGGGGLPTPGPPATPIGGRPSSRPEHVLPAAPMAGTAPDAATVEALRRGFDTGRVCNYVEQAYRGGGSLQGAGSDYYFLSSTPTHPPAGPPPHLGAAPPTLYDPYVVRRDFPALHQRVHGRRLVWLDNAATTQKPQVVISALRRFYEHDNSNIHRGAHELAARATEAYEGGREKVRTFLGAASVQEVVFVRGTTEAINLVAQSYGRRHVGAGDDVIVSELEHHSNIVPWQLLCQEMDANLRVVPINDLGEVRLDEYAKLLGPRTRVVALSHVSNALGTVVPVEVMTQMAHAQGAAVLIDGAQAVPHMPVDVQAIGCDFYAFSGHKLFGPTGVGVLWGRQQLLEEMPPWQGGGQMIKTVTFEGSTFNDLPYKFEAGTGVIAGAIGLGAAIDYVSALGLPAIAAHEHTLLEYGMAALNSIPGVTLIGTAPLKAGALGFVLDGMAAEDVGRLLDQEGIAVRAGHHCAQPALRHFGLTATVRPSLGLYNTHDDIDRLVTVVHRASRSARRR